MFIIAQFPFTDLRNFSDTDTYKLEFPDLKNIDPYKHEFIRCFGPLQNRYNALKFPSDEAIYSKANRAIRFNKIEKHKFSKQCFAIHSIFRRFYSNFSNCRVELGFKNLNSVKFSSDEFFVMLNDFLNIPVYIPSNKKWTSCESNQTCNNGLFHRLISSFKSYKNKVVNQNLSRCKSNSKLLNASTKLASLYLHATTKYPEGNNINLEKSGFCLVVQLYW